MSRPSNCVRCARAGHVCPAAGAESGEPLCRDCAEGEPCLFERCAGRGRETSSTAVQQGECGALVFAGDAPSEIRTRTPEELGIERVTRDEPRASRLNVRPDWSDGMARGPMREAGVKRDRPDLPRDLGPRSMTLRPDSATRGTARGVAAKRNEYRQRPARPTEIERAPEPELNVIAGEPVRMPAHAVMGAEMLAPAGQGSEEYENAEKAKESKVNQFDMTNPVNVAIIAEGLEPGAKDLAAKYKVPLSRIYALRCQARADGKLAARKSGRTAAVKAAGKPAGNRGSVRPVEIDAQRNGSAAALITTLDKVAFERAEIAVALNLTMSEIGQVLARSTASQQKAFLEAGLRAALLAQG